MAALETGVQRKEDVVCLQEPLIEREGVRISYPAYNIRKRKRVWTAVRQGSGFATKARTDLSKNTLGDVIVVDIKRRGEKMTRIVNIYDQKAGETGERPVRTLNWQKIIREAVRCLRETSTATANAATQDARNGGTPRTGKKL
jgi:hypothetical protein